MSSYSPFNPKLPANKGSIITWGNLNGSAIGLAITQTAKNHDGLILVVTQNILTAQQLYYQLRFFNHCEQHCQIALFPDWEILPYDNFSPHQDIISQRIYLLSKLLCNRTKILIININTLMQYVPPTTYISKNHLKIKTGQTLNFSTLKTHLINKGYQEIDQVNQHGEFSTHGSIIDIFPIGSIYPCRLELSEERIENIRYFDLETQRSLEKIKHINLLPTKEFDTSETGICYFRQNWTNQFPLSSTNSPLHQDVIQNHYPPGTEYYFPLFFKEISSIFDYLHDVLIIRYGDLNDPTQSYWTQIEHRYKLLSNNHLHPILPPEQLFLKPNKIFEKLNQFTQIKISEKKVNKAYHYSTCPLQNLNLNHNSTQPLKNLQTFLEQNKTKTLFVTETIGRQEIMLDLLNKINIKPIIIDSWRNFLASKESYSIMVASLDIGLHCKNPELIVITETELFGQKVLQRRKRKRREQDSKKIIDNLYELQIGDPVVHINHGVGRFIGLQTLQVDKIYDEYLTIEYANQNKLYVPIANLDLITRYSSTNIEHAPLHHLGGKQWQKIRSKAEKQIHDVAADLLLIYAKRETKSGFAYKLHYDEYLTFSQDFPFEETPDQESAILQTLSDMKKNTPMDRLICGDVGFGKTEVAMRAAFIAAQNSKQVAILVPTTLLAQQHYQNFCDRFAKWPINIELFSRFCTTKQQTHLVENLKTGKIDIVIGTHKLLQKNISFHDLGLLIVDEEHRFGVRQKEQIKSLRAEVDILTLTATPIPRTLNMALSRIRDLSIITTPPAQRLAIKTFIKEKCDHIIIESVARELLRGGQIYYIHNKVKTIHKEKEYLAKLLPQARIGIAHGQMPKRELEKIMKEFYHRHFNMLVCTTIIETGIDIPSANTIIIDNANKFGLAQLHQLRGRVGRSHHQAYAFLLVSNKKSLDKNAEQRLDAIGQLNDLGIGFSLATQDLEIRGVGELLGEKQSGHTQEIGLNLYTEMLDNAVKMLKSGNNIDLTKYTVNSNIEIDLRIPAIIPSNYIPDAHTRLSLYKRISNAKSEEELSDLRVEMIDRFGLLPQFSKNLFRVAELKLKLKLKPLGILDIKAYRNYILINFTEKPKINPEIIIHLTQKYPNTYSIIPPSKLKISVENKSPGEKLLLIENLSDDFLKSYSDN